MHQTALRPDGCDICGVHGVEGALKPLGQAERPRGLGEAAVIHHDSVQAVAGGEAAACAEIAVAGGRAEVVRLGHGQKRRVRRVGEVANLGRLNAHRDHAAAGEGRACGNICAEGDVNAFVQHFAHRRDAAAQVDVGVRAVCHNDACLADGGSLALVRVDAVRHDRVAFPQAELVVALPILRAVRVERAHPCDFVEVFRQVRLDVEVLLGGNFAERGHQLVCAGWGKARRDNRADKAEAAAALKPAARFADGLLGGLLKVFTAVAVHVDLADKAGHTGVFELLHQNERRVRVERGKHAHARCAVCDEVVRQTAVDAAGVVEVCELRLDRERVGFEPVEQRQVHTHADVRKLGRVQVHIGKRLHDELT